MTSLPPDLTDIINRGDISAATRGDAEFQELIRELAKESLRVSLRVMKHGNPTQQRDVAKSVLPAVLRELREEKEDDELVQMRADQKALMAEMREVLIPHKAKAGVLEDEAAPPSEFPPTDDPPVPLPQAKVEFIKNPPPSSPTPSIRVV